MYAIDGWEVTRRREIAKSRERYVLSHNYQNLVAKALDRGFVHAPLWVLLADDYLDRIYTWCGGLWVRADDPLATP